MRIPLLFASAIVFAGISARADERPNILWISSEDHNPQMGCYGDSYAVTPNVDKLAARGMIYLHCWSCAPVCAPARTTIISGLYPPATGAEHMRSMVAFPLGKKMFPQFLREAGYYCTNNSKEDYNLEKPGQVWDDSSPKAHWKNRAAGQPFFAVFNSMKSHESKIREPNFPLTHDPAKVRVPAYHPDTPEVRRDWAIYYDSITAADADAGKWLAQLEADGLAEDTIVFYWADHGSGMPRSKRVPCDSGLHVPLVVYFPEKWKHLAPPEYKPGGQSERLVSFVDFAPTMLSLAGIEPPSWMHGHAFAGKFIAPEQPFLYGFRGRMDERPDLVRSVTDGRYVYLRNYMPHLPWGQHNEYMFETPTTRVWKKLFDEGKLNDAQSYFWQRKAPEELYDLQNDRDEIKNLASSPEHAEIKKKLRDAQQALAKKIRDIGFLPEGEIHTRGEGSSPYDYGQSEKYPFEKIFAAAELASMLDPQALGTLRELCKENDSAVRYWGALGLLMRGENAVKKSHEDLQRALEDKSPHVRIAAAQALAQFGSDDDLKKSLPVLLALADAKKNGIYVSMDALNAIDNLGKKSASEATALGTLPEHGEDPKHRADMGVSRLLAHIKANLK